ncbi:LexA repressor, partial [Microbacterium sp. SUBG005]
MREIGDAVGLKSLSSVTHQLNQLELSGYLRRDPGKTRAMEVLIDLPGAAAENPADTA